MQHIRTHQCAAHGHPELTLEYDPARLLKADARWFASSLEQMIASGSRFQAGQSLQIGWLLAWFTSREDGTLGFEEPDMQAMPVVRQSGLTNTLGQLRLQKDALESALPADMLSFPNLRQSCILCNQVTAQSSLFMNRLTSVDMDSGWFIGCLDKRHNHNDVASLRRVSLYEMVVKMCPSTLAYLAFPPESMIVLDGGIHLFRDGEQLPIRPGSFLDRKRGQRQ